LHQLQARTVRLCWCFVSASLLIFLTVQSHAFAADAQIRVNQVGFLPGDNKEAFLLSSGPETGATFTVLDANGTVEFTSTVDKSVGSWNAQVANIYKLDFSLLQKPGTYTIAVAGPLPAVSPVFHVATAKDLYIPLLHNSLFFFQAQRDGPDVIPTVLNRKPSHLSDTQAFVYKNPDFTKHGMNGTLEKIAGPIDVSGGWADAGDYLKFVQTASYVTGVMLEGARDYPAQMGKGGDADFAAEGRFGLDWLLKMWDAKTKTLYIQVGIGDGNEHVQGDHDLWRLPEADDAMEAKEGSPEYFIKHRAVFAAGPAGAPISPNLAGRLAAAFALGYQTYKTSDPAYATRLLQTAEDIFDRAQTTDVKELTTTCPRDFYPEDEWRDDMEWGATELYFALAGDAPRTDVPHADSAYYLAQAAHWARAYLNAGTSESLNLYDVSGLAHYQLCRAIDKANVTAPLEVTRANLLAGLKRRLDSAVKRSGKDPFGFGLRYATPDPVPHILGLVLEAQFYDELSGTTTYDDFARRQLGFVLGANSWGTSFIVGAGKVFPYHMQHQVANLVGSLDGTPPLLLGATVDGFTRSKSKIKPDDVPDGARATPWPGGKDPYADYGGGGVQYIDDVSSWATVEPACDYTISTALIFARLSAK
jgi:endoglucanase